MNKNTFLIVKSSPTHKPKNCFYYALDYNLGRFEQAQGYIPNYHFNAKQSVVSQGEVFFVISLRFGESEIRKESRMKKKDCRNALF